MASVITPVMENGKSMMSLNSMLKVESIEADSPQMGKNGSNSDCLVNTMQNGDQLPMFVGSYPFTR